MFQSRYQFETLGPIKTGIMLRVMLYKLRNTAFELSFDEANKVNVVTFFSNI